MASIMSESSDAHSCEPMEANGVSERSVGNRSAAQFIALTTRLEFW